MKALALLLLAVPASAVEPTWYVHDLLVVYSPASKARYGQEGIEGMIRQAVAEANQAYVNSQVRITLSLVGLQEVNYVEQGGQSLALQAVQNPSDGKIDEVHALRNTLNADLVAIVSEDTGCGISFIMAPESVTFEKYAFSAVYSGCLQKYTLAHELGHLQGNAHDIDSSAGVSGSFPYSHGYRRCVSDGSGFRDIMATNCAGAPRVPYFSNPNLFYAGYPMGIAGESDAARSMNETADTVAAFRPLIVTPPPKGKGKPRRK